MSRAAAPGPDPEGPVVALSGVGVRRDGRWLLADLDLELAGGEHLAVLGPNGAGKTTLLRLLATHLFPTTGTAEVLGARFGAADLRALRRRVALVSVGLDPLLAGHQTVRALVAAARQGALTGWGVDADAPDARRDVDRALARVGAEPLADRRLDTCSQGERQRVRIARALVGEPELLLLDEPMAGLDLGGREALLADLERLLAEPDGPTMVLVTHHLEELPPGMRRALLLAGGRATAAGPAARVLTSARVSSAFGLAVEVTAEGGRYAARVRAGGGAGTDPGGPGSTGR